MPLKNARNPTRKVDSLNRNVKKRHYEQHSETIGIAGICSTCKTEVLKRHGFRPSSLKCPKCGKSLG